MKYISELEKFRELEYFLGDNAQKILNKVAEEDKQEDFMDFLEDYYNGKTPTLAEITNFIAENWQHIFKNIGINENF